MALPPLSQRIGAVLALLVLSPIAAEYLSGYDDSVGNLAQLLMGLLILTGLYGAPTLLIREATRRTGRGWPTILTLAVAAGLIQAALIDQALFNDSYRDIPYWEAMRLPTLIPQLDISASMVLGFVGGHVIFSYAAPIAVIEACAPRIADRPWLGKPAMVIVTVLYLLGAAFILQDQYDTEGFAASGTQLSITTVIVVALVVAALTWPQATSSRLDGRVLPAWALAAVSFVIISAQALDVTWTAVVLDCALLTGLAGLLWYSARREAFTPVHVFAVAAAALLSRATLAFLTEPLGSVDLVAKYTHNTVLAAGVVALLVFGYWRLKSTARDTVATP